MKKRYVCPRVCGVLLTLTVTLSACSNMVSVEQALGPSQAPAQPLTRAGQQQLDDVKATIYRQYRQWQGTGYAYGGIGKNGLDCSGLVYITYRDELGVSMPRTTAQQRFAGSPVRRDQLRAGDLVFFKTSYKYWKKTK